MEYEFIRNADVKVAKNFSSRGGAFASVDIGDYHVDFPMKSAVSQFLNHNEPSALQDMMAHGSYFFVNNELVDFRFGSYTGFEHTDHSIEQLMNTIGCSSISRMTTRSRDSDATSRVQLLKQWDNRQVVVNVAGHGGTFNTSVMFGWSPFHHHISTQFNIIRMICTNGMIAKTPVLTRKVPLINRWEDHLNIAARQLLDRTEAHITDRLEHMIDTRASVADAQQIEHHINTRIKHVIDSQQRLMLETLANQVSPTENLVNFYNPTVFDNRSVTSRLPSHLTQFDAYNIVTQVRSHTSESPKSTANALDIIATRLLFDDQEKPTAVYDSKSPSLAFFSDPEQAFFGV